MTGARMNKLGRTTIATVLLPCAVIGAGQAANFTPCADAGTSPALAGSLCAREEVPGDPSGLSDVPGKNLRRFFGALLDIPAGASQIPHMVKALDSGDGAVVKRVLADVEREMATLGAFPQSPPSLPLVMMISGSENDLQPRRTQAEVDGEEAGLLFASSLPSHLVNPSVPLYPRDTWFARLPQRLPPTLVLHGRRDAKTPYDAAVRHVEALRKAGPVTLHADDDGVHFMLWTSQSCAAFEARRFVLGEEETGRCVSVVMRD